MTTTPYKTSPLVYPRIVGACVAVVVLAACGTLSRMEQDPDDTQAIRYARSGDLRAEVDSLARALVETDHTPGVVVGVLTSDGKTQFFGYGVGDKSTGAPPDADTLFPIGSLSKGFLGAVTSVLVADGVLSWDDTLEQLLPRETVLSADARGITVLQLATHTSGLPRQPMTPQTLSYFIQYLFTGTSFYRHFDREYAMHYLADFSAPSTVEPLYSNIGFGLLGYVIERRTGMSLDRLLEQRILRPLDLSQTGYVPEALPGYAQRAHGYAGDQPKFIRRGDPVPDWEFTDLMKGSAAMYSSARDLLTFAAAHMRNDGTRYSAVLAGTLQVRFPRKEEAAAVAWLVDDIDGEQIAYQIGFAGGYTGYIGLDAHHHMAVVILQNSFNWASCGHQLLMRLARAEEQQPR